MLYNIIGHCIILKGDNSIITDKICQAWNDNAIKDVWNVKPLNGKILIKIKLVTIFFFQFNPDGIYKKRFWQITIKISGPYDANSSKKK